MLSVSEPTPAPLLPLPTGAPEDWPVTVIERQPGWRPFDLRELWRYRELLFFLTWRDIKLRYKQTVLGAAWALLQPLATMLVFTAFLGDAAGGSDKLDYSYSLFVFAGLLPWIFFANALTSAGSSVVGNQNLVTKVYFPRLIIPMGAVSAGLVDFAIAFVMLIGLMIYHGIGPGWGVFMVPLIFVLLITGALGMGILLSALTVAYRDFRFVVPFMVQLWMFATPCIYLPEVNVGPTGHALLPLNPTYGLILNFRQAMLGQPLDWPALAISGGVSVLLLFVGCFYFRRVERSFADII